MLDKKLTPGDRRALISRLRDLTTNIDSAVTALYATGLARSSLLSGGVVTSARNDELATALALADKTTEKLAALITSLENEGN